MEVYENYGPYEDLELAAMYGNAEIFRIIYNAHPWAEDDLKNDQSSLYRALLGGYEEYANSTHGLCAASESWREVWLESLHERMAENDILGLNKALREFEYGCNQYKELAEFMIDKIPLPDNKELKRAMEFLHPDDPLHMILTRKKEVDLDTVKGNFSPMDCGL
jgi:hypothetical protein